MLGPSANMLPRPHHDFALQKALQQSEKKMPGGGLGKKGDPNQRGYHSDIGNQADKGNYQPVPDGRFYTKANFFSLAD